MKYYGTDLFKDTAWYYSRYRPLYPSALIRYLVNKFSLDGTGRMLDLGCGTGQLALRFTDWLEEIVGIDTEQEMLVEANRLSNENRVGNVRWLQGKAEDRASDAGTFRLVTIAKSFHWMDRELILQILFNNVEYNGGIAIIDNDFDTQEPLLWQQKLNEVVKSWLGEERRAGNSTYTPPIERFEHIVARSNFRDVERRLLPSYSYIWTIDSIIGNLYSTSFASRRFFGDKLTRFEDDVKSALLEIDAAGVFTEALTVSVITAFK